MEAIIVPNTDGMNARKHRKENHFYKQLTLISFDPDKADSAYTTIFYSEAFKEVVTMRFYEWGMTTSCCVWLHHKDYDNLGSEKVTGYGFHCPSEAAHFALKKAGITLSKPIASRGDDAIKYALEAIAKALELKHWYISEAYG